MRAPPFSAPSTDAETAERRIDASGSDLVEHALDELRLDGDGLAGQLGEALDRPDDRRARRLAIEPVEPERVREEARDTAREAIELGQRVLAQRDEDIDPRGTRKKCREQLGEGARPGVVRVIEEVLLGLVEHEVDVSVGVGVATASASGAAGSSLQREKTTTRGSSGSSLSDRATAARRSDDLPTPLGP